ncbi:unnamed protein product [Leptosia nina]|uniref:OTU domain-containing protein n=1 Tax=Leptosia nina TaxID=320188 RepID=A0AAV1JM81_9NEOP
MENITDDVNNILSLECRQKKERKELQAKIQSLKKVAKNNKSKKKEITNEIARLEAELEACHIKELEESQRLSINEGVVCIEEDNSALNKEDVTTKISKAKRRRNKKIQEEREIQEQIKIQEKENRYGPRNIEKQEILKRLKPRNLQIVSITSDGDCLYKAIAHQLHSKRNTVISTEELRKKVSCHIRTNKDDFIPFLTNPDTSEMLTDVEFDEYCEKICNTRVWGGQLEIRALSDYFKCPILVIQATGPEAIEQGSHYSGPPLIITYHRHMYSLGEHYNSTQPFTHECDLVPSLSTDNEA